MKMLRNNVVTLFAALLVFCVGTIRLHAQSKPNVSGNWTTSSYSLSITQDGSTLTVTEPGPVAGPRKFTYQLDRSESRHTVPVGDGTWTHTSRVRWVTNALMVLTTTTTDTGGKWEMKIYSFTPDSSGNLSVTTLDAVLVGSGMWTETRIYRKNQVKCG